MRNYDKMVTARAGDAGWVAVFVNTAEKICNTYFYPTRGKARTHVTRVRREAEQAGTPLSADFLTFVRPIMTDDMFGMLPPKGAEPDWYCQRCGASVPPGGDRVPHFQPGHPLTT